MTDDLNFSFLAIPYAPRASYPIRSGNVLRPLIDGEPSFRRICDAIEHAKHSVWATVTLEPSLAKDRADDNEILTFGFFSDIHVNLNPLAKDMAGVYKQRIQYKQVGKLKWNNGGKSIDLG